MNLEKRQQQFKKEVSDVGGLLYTKLLLEDFTSYWMEPDRAKRPKMRFEKQPTWCLAMRLGRWARVARDYNPYLSIVEKSIETKKRDLIRQLEPFQKDYSRDVLNAFYRFWSQPENKMKPEMIRWEHEKFWDVSSRLKAWSERQNQINTKNL